MKFFLSINEFAESIATDADVSIGGTKTESGRELESDIKRDFSPKTLPVESHRPVSDENPIGHPPVWNILKISS
jgi:hypothetical protein